MKGYFYAIAGLALTPSSAFGIEDCANVFRATEEARQYAFKQYWECVKSSMPRAEGYPECRPLRVQYEELWSATYSEANNCRARNRSEAEHDLRFMRNVMLESFRSYSTSLPTKAVSELAKWCAYACNRNSRAAAVITQAFKAKKWGGITNDIDAINRLSDPHERLGKLVNVLSGITGEVGVHLAKGGAHFTISMHKQTLNQLSISLNNFPASRKIPEILSDQEYLSQQQGAFQDLWQRMQLALVDENVRNSLDEIPVGDLTYWGSGGSATSSSPSSPGSGGVSGKYERMAK